MRKPNVMTDRERDDIDAWLDRILYDPPKTQRGLRECIEEVETDRLRSCLIGRIETGNLDDLDALVIAHLFDAAGLGGVRERLVEIVASPLPDEGPDHRMARKAAFLALAMNRKFQPEDPRALFDLSAERYTDLAASIYRSLFEFAEMNLELTFDFGRIVLEQPAGLRRGLFEAFESHREGTDVDAGLLYRPLLEEPAFRELWPMLLDAVRREGNPQDAAWIQRAAEEAPDEGARKEFQKAAMELRTEGLEASASPEGFALLGTPDGSGAIPLFVATECDEEIYAAHTLVFRPGLTISEGFFVRNVIREEIGEITGEIERARATEWTEIPVDVGVEIARTQIRKTDIGLDELPPETRLAGYRLERMPRTEVALPEVQPAASIDRDAVRSCIRSRRCFESWFFDRSTLDGADALPIPESDAELESWITETASSLVEAPNISERIVSNLRWMARWFALDERPEFAGQFGALADEAEEDFRSSFALEVLLGQTVVAVREMQEYADAFLTEMLGDGALRCDLRERHLEAAVPGERGEPARELQRRLDYMELTFRTLEEFRGEVSESRQPDSEQIAEAAGAIGSAMASFFADDSSLGPPNELADSISYALSEVGIDKRLTSSYISELLTNGRLLAMSREDSPQSKD